MRTLLSKVIRGLVVRLLWLANILDERSETRGLNKILRKRVLNDMRNLKSAIWMGTYQSGTKIDIKQITLSYTEYTEILPGVYHRAIQNKTDINARYREPTHAKDILSTIDFDSNIVVFQKCIKGAYKPPHVHNSMETIIILHGDLYDPVRQLEITKKDPSTIQAYTLHSLYSHDESISILQFSKGSDTLEFDLGNEKLRLIDPEDAYNLDQQFKSIVDDSLSKVSREHETHSIDQ